MDVADMQRRLRAHGFDPGPIDGAFGRLTRAALIAFQRARGLDVKWPGTVGPRTLAALGAEPSDGVAAGRTAASEEPVVPWYAEAERLLGTREVPGATSNPAILGWARALGGWVASWYRDDDTPWCALLVGYLMGLTLPDEPLPRNPLGAADYATFGVPLRVPVLGAVLVFTREGGGHVGFYAGEDAGAFHVLGGNQSDSVSVARIAKSRLMTGAGGVRWPRTYPLPTGGRVPREGTGVLSRAES